MPTADEEPEAVDPRVVRTRNDVLSAVIDIVIEHGLEAVTQPNVARHSGYSKATVYAHWPDRVDLVHDAFSRLGGLPHHEPTGDLRTDLVGELRSFRRAMEDDNVDRILAVLAERSSAQPELAPIRDRCLGDGERVLRNVLAPHLRGARLEAAVFLLCGTVVYATLMHGTRPTNAVIDHAVDAVMTMTRPTT